MMPTVAVVGTTVGGMGVGVGEDAAGLYDPPPHAVSTNASINHADSFKLILIFIFSPADLVLVRDLVPLR